MWSCIVSRIVPLNVDKEGEMFCGGFCKKSVSYNTYSSDSSSWILNGLVSSFVDVSDDESGMAKDILFKSRVEATKQMTQNWIFFRGDLRNAIFSHRDLSEKNTHLSLLRQQTIGNVDLTLR